MSGWDQMQRCQRCMGNGEIITDWDIYLNPPDDEVNEDDGTADCPDCDGTGRLSIAAIAAQGGE